MRHKSLQPRHFQTLNYKIDECQIPDPSPFILIVSDHAVWSDPHAFDYSTVKGAFVKATSPADLPESIFRVVESGLHLHAKCVFMVPQTKSNPLTPSVVQEAKRVSNVREIIDSLIDESNLEDKDSVRMICHNSLSKVGL